jgi:hypothetical protein
MAADLFFLSEGQLDSRGLADEALSFAPSNQTRVVRNREETLHAWKLYMELPRAQ